MKKKLRNLGLLLCYLIFFNHCTSEPKFKHLRVPLDSKKDFSLLIKKYQRDSNQIKLKALYFLLDNIKYHKNDSDLISAQILETNIDLGYKASIQELADNKIDFEDFCEFVVPYRVGNESLENWREKILYKYGDVIDSLKSTGHNAIQIATYLNNIIRKGFIYRATNYLPDAKNWSVLFNEKKGGCVEMAHTIVYPLRTFGIATSIDYTVCWANSNGYSHMWNALISNEGNIPFMGMEANPDGVFKPFTLITNKDSNKTTYRLCGKVFRKTYSPNVNIPKNDIVFQNSKFFKDVTSEYFTVTNLEYSLSVKGAPNSSFYISNYTNGKWIPVFYGTKKNGKVRFSDLANNILYLPFYTNKNQEFNQLDFPVIILKNGKIIKLRPRSQELQDIKVTTINSIEEDQLSAINRIKNWDSEEFASTMRKIVDGTKRSKPKNGEKYNLYYWEKDWVLISSSIAKRNHLLFKNIPSNCLYKVVSNSQNGKERPFTYHQKIQKWW